MKKVLSIAVLLAAVVIIFSSCGKYEEGPLISLKSKKARIAGEWIVEDVYINDVVQEKVGYEQYFTMKIEKDGTAKSIMEAYTYTSGGTDYTVDAWEENYVWEFDEKCRYFRTKGEGDTEWGDWLLITRLTEKELWYNDAYQSLGATVIGEYHYVKK